MALLKSSRWLVVFCATILAIAVFLTGSVQSAPAEETLVSGFIFYHYNY
jgi:hypothetical protein